PLIPLSYPHHATETCCTIIRQIQSANHDGAITIHASSNVFPGTALLLPRALSFKITNVTDSPTNASKIAPDKVAINAAGPFQRKVY
ncbi:UNVERIFIED_CONTAM: hypothetical protein NY603_25900, partial [Bacteroidetes bacterium 56_B9]